jgi:chemotaxis protein MotB
LRIQIVDEQNRPMFALASAQLQPYTREILQEIGVVLNDVPNKVGLSGHTDSTPYFTDAGYSNWELSADRANASRRALVAGGMADTKILRVVGLASAAHLDRKDPFNPINRRISIIVMNKKTEENVMRDGARLEVGADAEAPREAVAAPAAPAPAPVPAPAKK